MGTHFRIYKNSGYTLKLHDVVSGSIAGYSRYNGTVHTVLNDEVIYYYLQGSLQDVSGIVAGSVVVSANDKLTDHRGYTNVYWPDGWKCDAMGYIDVDDPTDYGAGFGNYWWKGSQRLFYAQTGGSHDPIYCYDVTIENIPMIFFTQGALQEGQALAYGFAISKNVFENSLTPRFGDDSKADDDSGYGDGEGGDGTEGTDAPTGNAMPIGGSGIHAYVISDTTYNSISSKLWGQDDNVFTALWYKFMNFRFNPIAGVINCIRLPSQFVPAGTSAKIQLAGVVLDDTGAALSTGGVQYKVATFSRFFGQYFADYNDHNNTRCSLHLPFCGVIDIAPSAIAGRTVKVQYVCDVLTGNVSARVSVSGGSAYGSGTGNSGGYIAQGTGNCAYSVPICGNDNGMGDKLATLKSFATGQINGAASVLAGGKPSAGDLLSGSTPSLAAGMFLAKHTTSVVGALGGGVGNVADLSVRLTIERVVPVKPANYQTTQGFMSVTGGIVGSYTGFTVFSSVNVSVAGATDEEKAEIERLLKEGVYI